MIKQQFLQIFGYHFAFDITQNMCPRNCHNIRTISFDKLFSQLLGLVKFTHFSRLPALLFVSPPFNNFIFIDQIHHYIYTSKTCQKEMLSCTVTVTVC